MTHRPLLKLRAERHLVLTFALRQALEVLQMPQQDLAQWLLNEIEKNPLLELKDQKLKHRFAGDFPARVSLYDHLNAQIRDHFLEPRDRKIAISLMHQLDERGYLPASIENSRILKALQTFDPPGIFARSIQESLLIQLRAKGLSSSDAYFLVEHSYDALVHGRYAWIQKKYKQIDLKKAIGHLSKLLLRPARSFEEEPAATIIPDLLIQKIEGGWTLELVEEDLPKFHIQTQYEEQDAQSEEEKEALRSFKTQAKWIVRSLNRRRRLLKDVGRILVRKQALYLDEKGNLAPLSMKEIAETLQVHESTLSRALFGKYIATPRGVLPLRSLINRDPEAMSAKEMLEKLIAGEDKNRPLTDDQLADVLKEKGFHVARRTVAKYRVKLKIASASQRKAIS